jgi:guanosine-3',5'-bis(diphosphate) 3'-pyrophosphohydrolase
LNKHIRLLRAVAFAAEKHKDQRRKDANSSPYINHVIAVASVLAEEGGVTDEELIMAAILHDTVEDTETTREEIEVHFGKKVASIVSEITDDMTLPKVVRKRLQEVNSPSSTADAKQLRIADKICNVRDIAHSPPADWSLERKREYLQWTVRVVAGCRGINPLLDKTFDAEITAAATHLGVLLEERR